MKRRNWNEMRGMKKTNLSLLHVFLSGKRFMVSKVRRQKYNKNNEKNTDIVRKKLMKNKYIMYKYSVI